MSDEQRSTPDLSRIVSMIMERPDLVAEIAALGSEDKKPEEKKEAAPTMAPTYSVGTERRTRLLSALKPYLSESRAKAIDSILTFGEVFDMMRGGK